MAVRYLSSCHGCLKYETSVISARVFQGERWLEDIAICRRFPFSSCYSITYVFRRIRTSHFLAFSLHSSIISFRMSHQIISAYLLSTWMRCFYSRADQLGSLTQRDLRWENRIFRSYFAQSSLPSTIQRQEFDAFQDANTTFGKRGLPLMYR